MIGRSARGGFSDQSMIGQFPSTRPLIGFPGERRRLQLRPRLRVLPAQKPHLSRIRDARTKFIRLFEEEQVRSIAAQIHPTHNTTGSFISGTKDDLIRNYQRFII